ncbi:MAG: glycosyltransferase family A protein [Ilumatobacteraceae bacterium]|nr:glycosyltransferase family A protein [Ilumatobacteraceae bacterium]
MASAATSDVFVGVASIPDREDSLRRVIDRLLPQAAKIGVYLNGYERIPGFLRRDRIVVERSQDHGDVRDNGKFFFLGQSTQRYYATVDDDISYPTDYIEKLTEFLVDADQLSAVGVHGALYPDPIIDLFDARVLLHFEKSAAHVAPVHLLGTGTTMFDQQAWQLRFDEFGTPGMADVWFAKAAVERGASCFVVPRKRKWLQPIRPERAGGGALFHEGLHSSSEQVTVLREARPSAAGTDGLVGFLLRSDRFLDRLSLHQALDLDRVRRQLGFEPISASMAAELREAIERRRRTWSQPGQLPPDGTAVHGSLIVDVLAGTVTADSVAPSLSVLDRTSALVARDPDVWNDLPYGLQLDSRSDRFDEVRSAVLSAGMQATASDAHRLWELDERRAAATLDQALAAARAGAEVPFERLPALVEQARERPESAAKFLYEFLQILDGARSPDVTGLRLAFGDEFESLGVGLPVCQALLRAGDIDAARRILTLLRKRSPADVDVRLMAARLDSEVDEGGTVDLRPAFSVIDDLVRGEGLIPWTELFLPGSDGHWIHRMRAPRAHDSDTAPDRTVSVIMTTHNDETTIEPAVESILASTGVTVELVIVDDRSTDGTLARVSGFDDPRIKLVSNDLNVGPYVSRNRALERCTGRYVAIADADDWSHPQRLAHQCSLLEASPHVHGCKVGHVRVCANGDIDLENNSRFVGEGPMSLMFRRWLVDHVGGFDHIRTRGDVEFMRRVQSRFGSTSLESVGVPLVLASSSPHSNSKRFSEGSLNLYRTASRRWHERHRGRDSLYVPLTGSRAPFMAPADLVVTDEPAAPG